MVKMYCTRYFSMLFAALFLVAFSGHLNAQTIFWGTGSGDATQDSIGRFISTDGTITGTQWTAVSNFDGGGVTPGSALWIWSADGAPQGTVYTQPWIDNGTASVITSPSIADGCALFDSDFLDTDGTGNFGAGTSPSTPGGHSGDVISPLMDLSGLTDSLVSVRFYLSYLEYDINEFSVGISLDNGDTWTSYDIQSTIGGGSIRASYNDWAEIKLTGAFDGATDLDSCLLRFRFHGDYYFAAIDDVSLVRSPDYDFAFALPQDGGTLGDAFTIARVSNNYAQPLSQVDPSEYIFAARLTNYGAVDAAVSSNVVVNVKVERDDNGSWIEEHTNSIVVDTILHVDGFADVVEDLGWVPTAIGEYRTTYWLTYDVADPDATNDTTEHYFTIVENYYSKNTIDPNDGGPTSDGASFPIAGTGNVVQQFEYGSMFFFPQGTAESDYQIGNVEYRVFARDLASGVTDAVVTVKVAKWTDGGGGGTLDGTLDEDPASGELEVVGIGSDTVVISDGNYTLANTDIISVSTFEKGVDIEAGAIYLVSLEQISSDGLEENDEFFAAFVGTESLNYGFNAASLDAVPSPLRVGEGPAGGAMSSNDWNWVGFGADQVPSIKINLDLLSSVSKLEETFAGSMNMFPNPVSNVLTVEVALDEVSDVQYIVSDMSGRILRLESRAAVQNDVYNLNVESFPAGVYFVTVKNASGTTTQRFVKK